MSAVLHVVVAALALLGSVVVLIVAVGMYRERDALSRVNTLGGATGVGIPLILVAQLLHQVASDGWTWGGAFRTAATAAALLLVSSVGSLVLGRAAYLSGAPVSPLTEPQELARPRYEEDLPDREDD